MKIWQLQQDKWLAIWAISVVVSIIVVVVVGSMNLLITMAILVFTLHWAYQFINKYCFYSSTRSIIAIRQINEQILQVEAEIEFFNFEVLIDKIWHPARLSGQMMMTTWLLSLTWELSEQPNSRFYSLIRINGALAKEQFSDLKREILK